MNNKRLLIILCLFLSFVANSIAGVCDLSGVISANQKASIDSQLVAYEKISGVRITITIAPSDKYKNLTTASIRRNEIVLLIVPEKKFCSVDIGDALKPWITNTYANIVLNRNMSLAFETNSYDAGIVNIVYELTSKIGSYSPYQREFIILSDEIKTARRMVLFTKYAMWTLAISGIFLVFYFPISRQRRMLKEKNKKRNLIYTEAKKSSTKVSSDDIVEELVR